MTAGYCFTHDKQYKLKHSDDVCPLCLKELKDMQKWRDSEDSKELYD